METVLHHTRTLEARPAMDDLDEIVAEFLVESHENLDRLDHDLVLLEQDPASHDLLAGVFRTIHTIKGTSGFLGLTALERVTHAGEDLLSRLRDGALVLTPERTSALLEMGDAVRAVLVEVERTGAEGDADHGPLVERLTRLASDEQVDETTTLGEILVAQRVATPEQVMLAVRTQRDQADGRRLGEILEQLGTPGDMIDRALATQRAARRSASSSTVRLDVGLLDTVVALVEELVLTRDQLSAVASDLRHPELARTARRLSLVADDLRDHVRRTRCQPVEQVWSRLPRVVRDLARSCGREVELVLEGRDVELDTVVIDAIRDPLTHLVRNAVDHGIEPPDVREARGKPRAGTLRLTAHAGQDVVRIEVSDDGAGIAPARLAERAVGLGLLSPAEAATARDPDLLDLIFRPGFSTATTISSVSGRGVGMDVVRTNIEGVGGTVEVVPHDGPGTTLAITVPRTVSTVPQPHVPATGALASGGVR
ncbi:MAG: Hpt domain-containing protein [Nocardioidaceae bacterium]|nr:Hpt domain-containing protein [Nocardioidaceae bacterium]